MWLHGSLYLSCSLEAGRHSSPLWHCKGHRRQPRRECTTCTCAFTRKYACACACCALCTKCSREGWGTYHIQGAVLLPHWSASSVQVFANRARKSGAREDSKGSGDTIPLAAYLPGGPPIGTPRNSPPSGLSSGGMRSIFPCGATGGPPGTGTLSASVPCVGTAAIELDEPLRDRR